MTTTTVVTNNNTKTVTLAEIKAEIKASLGTPQSNQNAATALAGRTFLAQNAKGETAMGEVLAELSAKGKIRARLMCVECNESHVREQSDWHQSLRCAIHATAAKAKLTDAEKGARRLARAQELVAKLTGVVASSPAEIASPASESIEA